MCSASRAGVPGSQPLANSGTGDGRCGVRWCGTAIGPALPCRGIQHFPWQRRTRNRVLHSSRSDDPGTIPLAIAAPRVSRMMKETRYLAAKLGFAQTIAPHPETARLSLEGSSLPPNLPRHPNVTVLLWHGRRGRSRIVKRVLVAHHLMVSAPRCDHGKAVGLLCHYDVEEEWSVAGEAFGEGRW